MRIVITGATGNVGTSTIESLAADSKITSILGLARRAPDWQVDKTEWAEADIARTDLVPLFSGADAVVHLAWLFQPTHDSTVTWRAKHRPGHAAAGGLHWRPFRIRELISGVGKKP